MSNDNEIQAAFDRLRHVLGSLPLSVSAEGEQYQKVTLLGSKAAKEIADYPGSETIQTSYSIASIEILAIGDHLLAMDRILTPPVSTFTPWAVARAILERSSLACWLLEEGISSQSRASRGMNVRLQYLEDSKKYVYGVLNGNQQGDHALIQAGRHIEEQQMKLVAQAKSLGIKPKLNKNGKLIGFSEGLPSATKLASLAHGEGDTYRLLSGSTHGGFWATRSLSLDIPSDSRVPTRQLTIEQGLFLMINCLDWYTRPNWSFFKLQGWDLKGLATVLDTEYDMAAIKSDTRFWKFEA